MGGMAFGTNLDSAREVTREVRAVYSKKLIVKLSPNVTNIVDFARVVEEEGADSVSLINTLAWDGVLMYTIWSVIINVTGGLTGPAIKPVALRMVWQVANAV